MITTNGQSINYPYLGAIAFFVVIAGIGEYLHLIPAGAFYAIFLVAFGTLVPSPIQKPAIGPNASVSVVAAPTISGQSDTKTPPHA